MAINIQDFRMAIRIDNSEAKAKFDETKRQIDAVKAEMAKLRAEGKENSAEYKEQKENLDKLNAALAVQRIEAGKTALSYSELRKAAASLKRQMDNATPGTEKWKALRADYLLTRQRMREVEVQARETRFSLSKMADGVNRYAAMGAGVVGALTGVALTARKCVDEYAEMEEAEAQVIKYTGMTRDEVKGLNEEFKEMDTRTAREKLNALAGDAGRLGITGKKDVLEFVDAADKINVALGEDLGDDAVKNIGKLAQMFGEDQKLGLRGAMLATGSAINEVAQNSSAAEAYLVGFTARVAGAANQAKVSQGDILGYASVLDQNMQQQEMAATAFQTLMMKMYQEPAKFAKIAGQSVEDFTSLIKKDANEAILQFLDTLNKKGGLDQLAPMFKEMGLDGVRASGVISTMAGKIDDIRKAQRLANDAYRDGTSIIKEVNVQNNTVQAGLDKAKNNFKDIRVELGEKLQPVMKYMITTGSLTVKGLGTMVSILWKYKGAIVAASAAVAAYTLVVKADTMAKSLWTTITKGATAAASLFNKTLKANPLGLVASVLAGVVSYLAIFKTRTNEATEAQEALNAKMERYETLMGRIAGIKSKADNLDLLDDDQKQRTRSETEAAISELKGRMAEEMAIHRKWFQEQKAEKMKWIGDDKSLEKAVIGGLKHQLQERLKLYGSYAVKKKELEAILAKLPEQEVDNPVPGGNSNGVDENGLDKELKAREEKLKQAMLVEQNLWKEEYLNRQHTEDEYNQALQDSEMKFLLERKALLEAYGKDTSDIQGQIYDKMIAEAARIDKAKSEAEGKEKQGAFAAIDSSYKSDRQQIKQAYLDGDIRSEEEYRRKLLEAERDYLEQKRAMQLQYGDDTTAVDDKLLDMGLSSQKEEKDSRREQGFKDMDSTSSFSQKNDILQAMYDADLITYEEYQAEKTRIAEEQEQLREDTARAAFDVIGQAASVASQVVSALQDAEVSKVTRKYDKEIKAAKKAGKDTTKLEEEKEEAINQVKKKYADKQFAASVLQVTASTAVAAMEAYKAMVGIPIVGPALGAIAAAAAIASGAAQIAVAKQQRDEAKGLKSGGYVDEYVEGYTKNGNPDDVAGVIPVHKNEFVANHEGVANPHVRQFLDVFDIAQKNGTIRMLNTTQILEQVRTRSGKYGGGYVDTSDYSMALSSDKGNVLSGLIPEQRSQVVRLLARNNELLEILAKKELVVDSRKVRDGIKRLEVLEGNVSR
ncbi:phage tail tape measure protein [uncultured Bacteroides sp.]|uniref:phage tail tape measure protein n=2 Tax=uncultured Bacteroides sp. TaxID=162156 RepID=UPI0025A97ED4|nr:phage tail tape measure protein [uncultured Bacteroides sp.]